MKQFVLLLTVTRPANVLMAAAATGLGYWLGRHAGSPERLAFLVCAAALATGFGNVANDIRDVETDRVSHPARPLPSGLLDLRVAVVYAVVLAALALVCSYAVSPLHALATTVPLALLLTYAVVLKGVPLAGNVLVASLVAYPLLFGALGSAVFARLWVPAGLAFLLNLTREVVKDMQDAEGDRTAGLRTSAVLPENVLNGLLVAASVVYLCSLFLPTLLGYFGTAYAVVCVVAVLPLHLWRIIVYSGKARPRPFALVSLLLKLEMLAGLAALALDELVGRTL
jgi:geranylgeranylglycerol-phosphate geranylgeranyltransferase